MPIVPGSRVGPYLIEAPLGSGGMGEVYRATDTRLDRAVAIKVLAPRLAEDSDALGRFEREAKAIAALSHPNILGIHELGTYDGVTVAATELLDGETLRTRLADGALPLRKSLEYAQQMAQGLAAAHGRGIVHRDVKPENLFITREGRLKILDFGLAKLSPATAVAGASLLTTPAETNPGTVLGTAGYMSPEQVRGETGDHRSDIFAFGAVLYEMLTGRRAFSGASAIETMAAVLREDPPDFSMAGGALPSSLEQVVRRCLEKLPDERFHSSHDLGFAIDAIAGSGTSSSHDAAVTVAARRRSVGWIERCAWLAIALAVGAAALWWRPVASTVPPSIRFGIPSPPSTGFYSEYGLLAVSPDERYIAFIASDANGLSKLWLRPLDSMAARPLPGTDGALGPFWSPDSRYVAFFTYGGHLMKIAIAGGDPQPLAQVGQPGGGTWNRDGVILMVSHFEGALKRVSSDGGDVAFETVLDQSHKEANHLWPHFLPDGRHYLFLVFGGDNTGLYVGTLGLPQRTQLLASGDGLNVFGPPVYAPSGHVLYLRGRTLMALPFDAGRQQATGEPIRVATDVEQATAASGPTYAATVSNMLVYSTGATRQPTQLVWLDRTGKEMALVGASGQFKDRLTLSPDDRLAATTQQENSAVNVWTVDVARGAFTKQTFDQFATQPVWSPDGRRLAYGAARDTPPNLYVMDAGNARSDRRVVRSPLEMYPAAWTPDGSTLLYHVVDAATGWDVWRIGDDGAGPKPLVNTRFNEREARLSRDARWMAYQSDESGRNEVYVVPAAVTGRRWQISTAGGSRPNWRKDGRELLYRDLAGVLQSVSFTTAGDVFEPAAPRPLFKVPGDAYDVTADGQKFLIVRNAGDPVSPPLAVVTNWTAALGQTR